MHCMKQPKGCINLARWILSPCSEFDALCLPFVKEYTPTQIKRLRVQYKASQAVFAAYLNTSISTVQKWEQGQKSPNGPSLKLLNLVDDHGLEALA